MMVLDEIIIKEIHALLMENILLGAVCITIIRFLVKAEVGGEKIVRWRCFVAGMDRCVVVWKNKGMGSIQELGIGRCVYGIQNWNC